MPKNQGNAMEVPGLLACRARSALGAGPGRRLAGASFMSSGASGGEKEGAGSYGR
jgi:hypothetical protein